MTDTHDHVLPPEEERNATVAVYRELGDAEDGVRALEHAGLTCLISRSSRRGWTYSGSLVGQSTFKESSPCSVKLRSGGKLGLTMTLVGAAGDRCRHREWPLVIGADGSGG